MVSNYGRISDFKTKVVEISGQKRLQAVHMFPPILHVNVLLCEAYVVLLGSYGNGAGMRAHPIGLACYGQPPAVVSDTAVSVARITHAHRLGVAGGLLQTLAVQQVSVENGQ